MLHVLLRIYPGIAFNYGTKIRYFKAQGRTLWQAVGVKTSRFTQNSLPDMVFLCKQAKVMKPLLNEALEVAITKCTSRQKTCCPLYSKKIFFDRLLRTFNDHVQVNFPFIREIVREPILHARHNAAGYAATLCLPNLDMDVAANAIVKISINFHGSLRIISADVEFVSAPFKDMLRNHGIFFEETPARRHNKILLSLGTMGFVCLSSDCSRMRNATLKIMVSLSRSKRFCGKQHSCATPCEATQSLAASNSLEGTLLRWRDYSNRNFEGNDGRIL